MAKIMIVDDQKEVRQGLKSVLRPSGFEVQLARSGKEAISKQSRSPANVVLLDMKMPKLDGVDTAKRLRALDPIVQFIGVTGFRHEYEVGIEEVGFYDVINKPVLSAKKKNLLVQCVRGAVSKSYEQLLGSSISTIADRIDERGASELIEVVRSFTNRLDDIARADMVIDNELTRDISKLSLLLGSALLLRESKIALELFSKVFFSEIAVSGELIKTLQRISAAQLADEYERDMRRYFEMEAAYLKN